MIVNKVDFKIKSDIDSIIQYQILTYCFFNGIQISNSDLKCLGELAKVDSVELTHFCKDIADMKIFNSSQSARNAITKAEKKKLIVKNGNNKKKISLSSIMNIQTTGTLLLDYKILSESKEA
jgi:hypothetical protein